MPLPFHYNRHRKMLQQRQVCGDAILPMLEPFMSMKDRRVLELGCGEAGVLDRFLDEGATGVGIDLSQSKIEWAQEFFADKIDDGRMKLDVEDIFQWTATCREKFDIIVLKDVIEHVEAKRVLMMLCKSLLTDGGILFVGFPPWSMPFGGHQQMADTIPGKCPWMHLLPIELYEQWLRFAGESGDRLEGLLELPPTRLSTRDYENLCRNCELTVLDRRLWLINPIYRSKFNLPTIPLPLPMPLRCDLFTTAAWYVVTTSS